MLPIIIIIVSSLILLFSILRKESTKNIDNFESNLNEYYNLPESSSSNLKMKKLVEAAVKNLHQRTQIYDKNYIIHNLATKRILSMKMYDNLLKNLKDLEYEQLVIISESENLKQNYDIFQEATKLLPAYLKKEEKLEKENKQKESIFYMKKKETLEQALFNRLKNDIK